MTADTQQTALGRDEKFRMPAEWEPHAGTWLAWPHEVTDWPGKFAPIPWAFAEIVRHLSRVENIYLIVEDRAARARAHAMLRKAGADLQAVSYLRIHTDRGWMRDSGPIAVAPPLRDDAEDGEALRAIAAEAFRTTGRFEREYAVGAMLGFRFNGWAKYRDHRKDAKVAERASLRLRRRVIFPEHKGRRVVLEGGAIDVNGRGTLLTTEECLLSRVQERNPGFTREDYLEIFRRYLGVTHVLWLKNGIAGDDTHGHVDDLARFTDPSTVVTVVENDPAEANYAPLEENLARLKAMKDQDGRPLHVETLPMPAPVIFDGQRLPASYANFYIANQKVLAPTFNDPADRVALAKLAELFPSHEIVPIYCRDLVLGLGSIHCMTQQIPRR
ncbi:MAG TPA: agmatine deiminase family protein [Candidatus Acidoferrales bacterium]|nr:agmatine deiminase family protein [Candidatus Acidoferrales bacterium]